jgi:hypothetical protein
VAFLIFLILPALSVTLGVVIGVFSDHYALPGVIGLAVGPPILLWRIGQRRTIAVLPVLLLLLYRFGSGPLILPMNVVSPSPAADRVLLKQALADRSAPPVAVTGGLMFLQLWYYLPADLRSQMIFLASPDQAAKYGRPDTIDRGLQALSRWTSLRTEEYHAFVQNHRSVRVYTAGSGWLLKALEDDGATLRIENRELGAVLYTAEMKSP